MKIIGLTGGIASGKSTVSTMLKELGAYIIDADVIAREIVKSGRSAWQEIVQVFGKEILESDGEINRRALGAKVFNNQIAREKLNNITHPKVIDEIKKRAADIYERDHESVVIIDAPLLIEANMVEMVDEVWLVALPESRQIERLMARDLLSKDEAEKRVRAQMPLSQKKNFTNHIIDTSGTLQDTKNQVLNLWNDRV